MIDAAELAKLREEYSGYPYAQTWPPYTKTAICQNILALIDALEKARETNFVADQWARIAIGNGYDLDVMQAERDSARALLREALLELSYFEDQGVCVRPLRARIAAELEKA